MDRDALSARLVQSLQELNVRRLHRRKAAEESVKSYYDVSLEAARASGDAAWLARLTGTVRSQWRYGQSVRLNLDKIIPELLERLILENNEGFDRNHEDLLFISQFLLKDSYFALYVISDVFSPEQVTLLFVISDGVAVYNLHVRVRYRFKFVGSSEWSDYEDVFLSENVSYVVFPPAGKFFSDFVIDSFLVYDTVSANESREYFLSSRYSLEWLNDRVFKLVNLLPYSNGYLVVPGSVLLTSEGSSEFYVYADFVDCPDNVTVVKMSSTGYEDCVDCAFATDTFVPDASRPGYAWRLVVLLSPDLAGWPAGDVFPVVCLAVKDSGGIVVGNLDVQLRPLNSFFVNPLSGSISGPFGGVMIYIFALWEPPDLCTYFIHGTFPFNVVTYGWAPSTLEPGYTCCMRFDIVYNGYVPSIPDTYLVDIKYRDVLLATASIDVVSFGQSADAGEQAPPE
jgi:hypothetical protein